jgi:hypothetical protein
MAAGIKNGDAHCADNSHKHELVRQCQEELRRVTNLQIGHAFPAGSDRSQSLEARCKVAPAIISNFALLTDLQGIVNLVSDLWRMAQQSASLNDMPPAMPQVTDDVQAIEAVSLLYAWTTRKAPNAQREGTGRLRQEQRTGEQAEGAGKQRGKRGRPSDTDAVEEKRIWNAWQTGHYRFYTELAREFKISEQKVKRAVDRARKRPKLG